jgi:hypothetical protein
VYTCFQSVLGTFETRLVSENFTDVFFGSARIALRAPLRAHRSARIDLSARIDRSARRAHRVRTARTAAAVLMR